MKTVSDSLVDDLLRFTQSLIEGERDSQHVPATLIEKHLDLLKETKRLVQIDPRLARVAILRESEIDWAISDIEDSLSAAHQRTEEAFN